MPEYKRLYAQLLGAADDALCALEQQNYGKAKDLLLHALQNAEEQILSSEE
ncbi:MAG: hypothetical protein ACI3VN_08130 [Candidatus Onthomonas sp.]